jgi:uncharacterized protein
LCCYLLLLSLFLIKYFYYTRNINISLSLLFYNSRNIKRKGAHMNQETLDHLGEAGYFFIYNFIELAVLFLGVSFIVEIINIYLNPTKVQKVLSSNKGGYLIASSIGALTPFCSCSTIPLMIGLIKAKASFGPIMTFLFTSPLLNPIIVAVFWSAFGLEVTLIYSLIAFFVSILTGYTLEKLGFEKYINSEFFTDETQNCNTGSCEIQKPKVHTNNIAFSVSKPKEKVESSCCSISKEDTNKASIFSRIFSRTLFAKTWKQFVSFSPYIAIGIGIGAFIHGFVPQEFLATYAGADNPLAIPISALIGVPLYIRAESMVGLAPVLLDQGVSMGSILALTVAGAGASLPEMIMLKKLFKMPVIIFFIVTVFSMAIGCGFLVNLYLL